MNQLRAAVLLALSVPPAFAQAPPATEKKDEARPVEGITVVGSRRANASATDTPVPIDIIPMAKAAEQGAQFDLSQTLTYISPSFNSTRQTGADGADLIDSAALRGLPRQNASGSSSWPFVLAWGSRAMTGFIPCICTPSIPW